MPLSEAGIVRYLVDHAILEQKDVVDGTFVAIPSFRQHRNFRIRAGDGPGFFVKQPGSQGHVGPIGLMREAGFYWLVSVRPPFTALADIVPRYVRYDPGRTILVLEAADGVASHRRQSLEKGFPPAIGTAVGKALAAVHRIERHAAGGVGAIIAEEPPWALSILEVDAQGGLPQNAGTQFALGIIGRHEIFGRQLARLRAGWRAQQLIHGDFKWDNCLVEGEASATPSVRIVDWEMAAWGDAAWDAGSLIQDYVAQGILASPLPPQAPPAAVAAAADQAMAAIRPAIAAFWSAYAPTHNPDFLRRSIAYAGARVLQTCVETLAISGSVTPNIAALLQLSHQMLDRPDAAATSVLGFQ